MSNLSTEILRREEDSCRAKPSLTSLDAENLALSDESYDVVFAHEVLHHCRSPHRALCEMLRVSREFVIFQEPNDSWFMRALTRYRFSSPFELPAVIDNEYTAGGVRDSQIPNYIYRWDRREVFKCVSSYVAERLCSIYSYPYWDFNATAKDLGLRKETRIGSLTKIIGAANFLGILRLMQRLLNRTSMTRKQGNKFLCCIVKLPQLRPWLEWHDHEIIFNRGYPSGERTNASPDFRADG
jgi:SAM-dependent methyltransferase